MDKARLSLYVPTAVSKRLREMAKQDQRSISQTASIVLTKAILDKPEEVEANTLPVVAKPKAKRFVKPNRTEVSEEFFRKGSPHCNDDADAFLNHYESNGWKVGKNPMKNWKAAIAQWVKRNEDKATGTKSRDRSAMDNRRDKSWAD